MTTPSSVVAQIERVLALGYTEGKRRRLPKAQLDVLLETTVAGCDIVALQKSGRDKFYLSDVSVIRCDNPEQPLVSSLAPFDFDVRGQLESWYGTRLKLPLSNEYSLLIPATALSVREILKDFWCECLRWLGAEPSIFPGMVDGPEVPDENIWCQFDHSLRMAFDAVAREDPFQTYTIRIDRRPSADGPYLVVANKKPVGYVMGYWLSSSMVLHLQNRAEACFDSEEVVSLEQLWRPKSGKALRTQSHTNVETRLAGLVRQQQERAKWLKLKSVSLERKAWGRPPTSIFMIPLSNHDLCEDENNLRTIAHAYVPVSESDDVVCLQAKRHRLSLIFTEALYEEYCRCLAHELTNKIIDGWNPYAIEKRCNQVAVAFGASMPLKAYPPDSQRLSLAERLRELKSKKLLDFDEREWPREESLLRNVHLCWAQNRLELDVLPHLVDQVGVLAARAQSDIRALRHTVERQMKDLRDSVSTIQHIHQELYENLARQRLIAINHLTALKSFFDGDDVCKGAHDQFMGWEFRSGHRFCGCETCKNELNKRVGYLFGGVPGKKEPVDWTGNDQGEQAAKTLQAMYDLETLWEVIKYACQKSDVQQPMVAAIMLLLLKHSSGTVALESLKAEYKTALDLAHFDWQTSLGGILDLARWEPPGDWTKHDQGHNANVEMKINGNQMHFMLSGSDMNYDRWLMKKVQQLEAGKLSPEWWTHSRSKQLAAAFAIRDTTDRHECIAVQIVDENTPRWTWRTGAPAC